MDTRTNGRTMLVKLLHTTGTGNFVETDGTSPTLKKMKLKLRL